MLVEDQAVFVRAMALPEEGAPTKISIQEMVLLENARVPLPTLISIKVRLDRTGRAQALQELFERKKGETQVRLRLENPKDFSVILDVPAKVRPDKEFRAAIDEICGAETLEVLGN
jgi:DNA polymerase-3 subunit alpha